jgi:multidrug resistance efflux pump
MKRGVRRLMLVVATLALTAVVAGVMWPGGPWSSKPGPMVLTGIVEIQEVRPASRLGGRVSEVLVREGDRVKAGDVLVRLSMPERQAMRDQAAARMAGAEAALEKARNGPRREEVAAAAAARDAAASRLARLRAGWRAEEIAEAEGLVASAESDWALARRDYERIAQLFEKGTGIGRSEYDAARAALDRAAGQRAAARARLDMFRAGSRAEDIAEAEAMAAQARAQFDLLYAGTRPEDIAAAEADVAAAKARLAELDADLAEAVIASPSSGVVEVLPVRQGDFLAPGASVARLLKDDDLWVRIYVAEPDLGAVHVGQKVTIVTDADPVHPLPGTLTQVGSVAEFTPRNVQSLEGRRAQVFGVKVRVDEPGHLLKSGMAATVTIPRVDRAPAP